jgi:hypothetical protein
MLDATLDWLTVPARFSETRHRWSRGGYLAMARCGGVYCVQYAGVRDGWRVARLNGTVERVSSGVWDTRKGELVGSGATLAVAMRLAETDNAAV